MRSNNSLVRFGNSTAALVAMMSLISPIGCDYSVKHPASAHSSVTLEPLRRTSVERIEWNCGIVVVGECSRISFPLSLPGVKSSKEIISVRSSCDCVKVEVRDVIRGSSEKLVATISIDRTLENEAEAERNLFVSVFFGSSQGGEYEAVIRVTLQ
jgi:hypothetical protein